MTSHSAQLLRASHAPSLTPLGTQAQLLEQGWVLGCARKLGNSGKHLPIPHAQVTIMPQECSTNKPSFIVDLCRFKAMAHPGSKRYNNTIKPIWSSLWTLPQNQKQQGHLRHQRLYHRHQHHSSWSLAVSKTYNLKRDPPKNKGSPTAKEQEQGRLGRMRRRNEQTAELKRWST